MNDIYKIAEILKTKSIFMYDNKVEGIYLVFKYTTNKYTTNIGYDIIIHNKFIIDKEDFMNGKDTIKFEDPEYVAKLNVNKISIGEEELEYLIDMTFSYDDQCIYIDADKKFIKESDKSENIVNLSDRISCNIQPKSSETYALIVLFNNEKESMFPNIRLYKLPPLTLLVTDWISTDLALDIAGVLNRNQLIFNSMNSKLGYTKVTREYKEIQSYNYYSDLSFYNSILSKEVIDIDEKTGFINTYKSKNGISAYKRSECGDIDVYYNDNYIYTFTTQYLSNLLNLRGIDNDNETTRLRLTNNTDVIKVGEDLEEFLPDICLELLGLKDKHVRYIVRKEPKKGYYLLHIYQVEDSHNFDIDNFFILYYPNEFIFAIESNDNKLKSINYNIKDMMILYDLQKNELISTYKLNTMTINQDNEDLFYFDKSMYTLVSKESNTFISSGLRMNNAWKNNNTWDTDITFKDSFIFETINVKDMKKGNKICFDNNEISDDNVIRFESDSFYKDDKYKYFRYDFGIPFLIS